ncbi:hypothetical protein [Bifidobacterium sp. SO1]|uniref:hypothetical protein n=1 Tax=Bifidobacterium sp. SO1 TaxID=2809029 RepID=UPI001BDDC99C|nr:hypothetical protein [Bifidobacterium sp. SO1]MBT1161261.1 hypothetical protein [Bifidobacterium sp. SO1]
MRLELELTIPSDLWWTSNSRGPWQKKWKRTRAVKELTWIKARNLKTQHKLRSPVFEKCHVTAYIAYPPNARRYDPGNASPMVKAAIDACTTAGYFPDDDSMHLVGPDYRKADHPAPKGLHIITLVMEDIE